MFNEEFTAASNGAVAKSALLKKNPAGYFLLSVHGVLVPACTAMEIRGEKSRHEN